MKIEQALNYLVFYNGYDDIVRSLLKHISSFHENETILFPKGLKYGDEGETVEAILWFLLVCMFGDYGTSPRFGWVEEKEEAIAFLNSLLPGEVSE